MRKYIFISFLLLISGQLSAQLSNKVYATQDFRGNGSNAIVIKWAAEKVLYERGFNVYRKSVNGTSWDKLNTAPILPLATLPAQFRNLPSTYTNIVNLANRIPEKDLHASEILRAFISLEILRSKDVGEALGVTFYDETAQAGATYQYKVEAIAAAGLELIGETPAIAAGSYQPLAAPINIESTRRKKYINLTWEIDEDKSLATVVEKRIGTGAFVPMDSLPVYIAKSRNESGGLVYPKVFVTDTAIVKGEIYAYRFAAVDFFGQTGTFSEPVILGMKGVEFPTSPSNPELEVNDLEQTINITWEYAENAENLRGFVVLYRDNPDAEPMLLTPDTIAADIRTHQFRVAVTGNYSLTVAAVDIWGNIGESIPVQAQVSDFVAPKTPKIGKVALNEGVATIDWSPSPDADLKGYYLHRFIGNKSQVDLTDLKYLNNNPIVATSFADSIGKALVGQVYYAVSAVDTLGNISELSKMVMALIPDFTAPSIPFIKRITPKDKALVVEFMENVDADLKEFILLKNTSKDSSRISLAPDATEYTDKDVVPGTEYTYTMLAQDLSGNWSAISGAYTMVAEGVDESMLMPIMPKSISAKYNKSKKIIEIAWSQLFNDDNLGAAIYKGETNDELALISPMLRTGAYDDKRVKAGNTYYYQIRTYAANGLKHQSELISVTIKEDKK